MEPVLVSKDMSATPTAMSGLRPDVTLALADPAEVGVAVAGPANAGVARRVGVLSASSPAIESADDDDDEEGVRE